jgi:4-amino-4-deoxy-L-arabinose transferase-like glycosyltransferase
MKKHGTLLAIIIALAVALRVVFWIGAIGRAAPLRGDEISYDAIARSLVSGSGFAVERGEPTASRPPLYPIVLAGVYRIAGARVPAGRTLQILLGASIVLLTYALARRLFGEAAALLAAALAAASPSLIFMSAYLLSENLYLVLLLLFLILVSRARARKLSLGACAAGGALLGLACLTRPNALPLALFSAGAYLCLGAGAFPRKLVRTAALLAAVALVILPWAVRNEMRFGAFVPFTTHGGMTFYQGNNRVVAQESPYHGTVAPLEALPGWNTLKGMGEVERDREAWRLGKEYVRSHPALAAKMAGWRLARFFRFTGDAGYSGVKSGWWWDKGRGLGSLASSVDFVLVFSVVAMPLFVAGLLLTLRRAAALVYLYGVVLVHTASAAVFFGSLRARMPLEPLIAAFAAVAAVRGFGALRRHFAR